MSTQPTSEIAGAARRMIRSVGVRIADEDPADLGQLRRLEAELVTAWATAINGLRDKGFSDVQIGASLGCSRQAVRQKWPWQFTVLGAQRRQREARGVKD